MLKACYEELLSLVALVLFVSTVLIWAQIISDYQLEPRPRGPIVGPAISAASF